MRRPYKLSTRTEVRPGPLPTPCWHWTGGRSGSAGYGSITRGGRLYAIHEYTFLCRYGYLPSGMVLDHLCDNRLCCNPAHLKVSTAANNCRRGRNAKLSREQADEIKRRRAAGEKLEAIAADYGVSGAMVSFIASGRSWGSQDKPHVRI